MCFVPPFSPLSITPQVHHIRAHPSTTAGWLL